MRKGLNVKQMAWVAAIASIMAFGIFWPSFQHYCLIDLDTVVERGSFAYSLVHDHRWIVLLMIGFFLGILHDESRGLLKRGLEEYREWKRTK